MSTPKIKICCISSVQEAQTAVKYGASALGLVGDMPSGPGVISDALIREIAQTIPPPVTSFLLTCHINASDIIRHYQLVFTNTIQLVDTLKPGAYVQLREALPGVNWCR